MLGRLQRYRSRGLSTNLLLNWIELSLSIENIPADVSWFMFKNACSWSSKRTLDLEQDGKTSNGCFLPHVLCMLFMTDIKFPEVYAANAFFRKKKNVQLLSNEFWCSYCQRAFLCKILFKLLSLRVKVIKNDSLYERICWDRLATECSYIFDVNKCFF